MAVTFFVEKCIFLYLSVFVDYLYSLVNQEAGYNRPMLPISAIVSVLVGSLLPLVAALVKDLRSRAKGEKFFESLFGRAILKALNLDNGPDSPERMFAELSEASAKLDAIVSRIQDYTKMREFAVTKLEAQLGELLQEEGQLRKKIEDLQKVPLPAAEYFATVVGKESKRGVLRDYILFVMGVVVSAIVTVILKHYGFA